MILIDTSSSLGALNISAMAAADEVIVTVNPQLLAMKGLQDFLKTVKKIRNRINEKLFDAVDMMTADAPRTKTGNGLQSLPVDRRKPFHDHPFHLYEGERLDDMVESIRKHGVLNPAIVRKKGKVYEMPSRHNRQNTAKIAGLSEILAIVKEGLTDEEAYVYVIETNVIQRSFTDLSPSEKARCCLLDMRRSSARAGETIFCRRSK